MPALSFSLINPALGQLQDLPAGDRVLLAGECPSLLECLERVPDPRDPRGVRHTLTSLLLASVAAVLAGARSFTAVGEWVADAPPQVLTSLGIRRDPLTGRFEPPDEATIRRVLESADAAALDAAVGSWLAVRVQAADQGSRAPAGAGGGRWPWMARRCGVPVMPAATGRPPTCWASSTSRPAPCSPRPPWTARPTRSPSSPPCSKTWT